MKRLEETLTTQLTALNVPAPKARRKAQNTVKGIYLMVVGTACLLLGFAILVVPFIVLQEHPGAWLIAFGALALLLGFYLGILGANAFSGDVSDAEHATITGWFLMALGKAIGFARKGGGDNDASA